MECDVGYTDEFGAWWTEFDEGEHLAQLKKEGSIP